MKLTCPVCFTEFDRRPSRVRRAKLPVCSRACHYKARSLGLAKADRPAHYNISPESKERMRAGARKSGLSKRKPPHRWVCEVCGKECFVARGRASEQSRKFRFCSHQCANAANGGENNAAWRGGHKTYRGPNWNRQRRAARRRDNFTCQDCGMTEAEYLRLYGRQLSVHHIRRFSDFEDYKQANRLDNLVTLCQPCHMKREWGEGNSIGSTAKMGDGSYCKERAT